MREGEKREIAWGSQIRSYVLYPYRMVKNHRTSTEVSNANSVLNDTIDPFIKAWLKHQIVNQQQKKAAATRAARAS